MTTNTILTCSLPPPNSTNNGSLPSLDQFIKTTYNSRKVPVAVQLFTLLYLIRLKSKLPDYARGTYDTPYRLFLAALLTSSKYLSETGTGLTSIHLAYMTCHIYSAKEINRMERSFLGLLRYDLWVSSDDVQQFIASYGDLIQIDIHQVSLCDHHLSVNTTKRCVIDNKTTSANENVVMAAAVAALTLNDSSTTATAAVAGAAAAANTTTTAISHAA